MYFVDQINSHIEHSSKTPKKALKDAPQLVDDAAESIDGSQAATVEEFLRDVHPAAIGPVLESMTPGSLNVEIHKMRPSKLAEFGSLHLRELLRFTRNIQSWGTKMSKAHTIPLLKNGYCSEAAGEKYGDKGADSTDYHPFTDEYLKALDYDKDAVGMDRDNAEDSWTETSPTDSNTTTNQTNEPMANDSIGDMILDHVQKHIEASVDRSEVESIVDEKLDSMTDEILDLMDEPEPHKIIVDDSSGNSVDADCEHYMFEPVLRTVKADVPVFLQGEPGSGKSTMAKHIGDVMGIDSRVISCSPDKREYHFLGYRNAEGELQFDTPFRELWENGGVILFDEVTAAHGSVLNVLNDAIASGEMEFADGPVEKHSDCIIMAADNTGGLGGTELYPDRNRLDNAFLDRFAYYEVETDWGLVSELTNCDAFDSPSFDFVDSQSVTAENWVRYCREISDVCKSANKPMTLGSRAAMNGIQLLEAGFPVEEVKSAVVFKSQDESLRKEIESRLDSDV